MWEGSNWIDLAIVCRNGSFRGHRLGWRPVLGRRYLFVNPRISIVHGHLQTHGYPRLLGAGWLAQGFTKPFRSSPILFEPLRSSPPLRPQVPSSKKPRILDPWSLVPWSLDPWISESILAASNPRILEVPDGSAGLEA